MNFPAFNLTLIPGTSKIPCLTSLVDTVENFWHFDPVIRETAIALHASELNISELHFYAIALHAGLEGVQ